MMQQQEWKQKKPQQKQNFARQPVFSVEYFVDGTVEVYLHASLSVSNRYAHLTQLLRDLRADPAWCVVRLSEADKEAIVENKSSFSLSSSSREVVGNLTTAVPQLLNAHTTVRFRLVPFQEAQQLFYNNNRVRIYDFYSAEQARFEALRIRLTHCAETPCSISINHLQCAETTVEALPDTLETTYAAWTRAADASILQCDPIITIVVQNKESLMDMCASALLAAPGSNEKNASQASDEEKLNRVFEQIRVSMREDGTETRQFLAKTNYDSEMDAATMKAFTERIGVKYVPPTGCERQTEAQTIYRQRGSSMFASAANASAAATASRGVFVGGGGSISSGARSIYMSRAEERQRLDDTMRTWKQQQDQFNEEQHQQANNNAKQQRQQEWQSYHEREQQQQQTPQEQPLLSLGQMISEMTDVSFLRAQMQEQAKQISAMQQQLERQKQQENQRQTRKDTTSSGLTLAHFLQPTSFQQ